jgi:hypothetical protein
MADHKLLLASLALEFLASSILGKPVALEAIRAVDF